jgi:hypothetical protein
LGVTVVIEREEEEEGRGKTGIAFEEQVSRGVWRWRGAVDSG